jgi:signal transduction histidine kinase
VVEDVTVKTELEQKIYQAEKLSTVSMLSAGMAHEINNPIGSILSNAQNLIEEEVCEERRASLRWIETEARRIARIVQELLKFAAPDTGQAPGSAVNAVIADVVRLVESTLGRENRIRIDTRLAEDAGSTALSPDELTQVTINLIANSIQAIPGAGRITVTTRLRPRKGAVCMTVADTGQGIPKNVLPRVFDPFFTTKANGQGTGLGLSVVWGIVTKHGGHVAVSSREGHGTRIVLDLPHLGDS